MANRNIPLDIEDRVKSRGSLSLRWFRRAKKDIWAARVLLRQKHSDRPLIVYLLAQSIEKMIKGVLIAGKGNVQWSHDSLRLYLEYLEFLLGDPRMRNALETYIDSNPKMKTVEQSVTSMRTLRTTQAKQVWLEASHLPADVVADMIRLLTRLKRDLRSAIRERLPSISTAVVDLKTVSSQDLGSGLSTMIEALNGVEDKNELMAQVEQAVSVVRSLVPDIDSQYAALLGELRSTPTFEISLDRLGLEQAFESVWAFLSLLMLAYIVYPHEGFTRYPPSSLEEVLNPPKSRLNTEDYSRKKLGVIVHLNRLVNLTAQVQTGVARLAPNLAAFSSLGELQGSGPETPP